MMFVMMIYFYNYMIMDIMMVIIIAMMITVV